MFFIEHGTVSLIDPQAGHRAPETIHENDAFGGTSMLTGARHTVTAVATEDTNAWELRRSDLDELLRTAPVFTQRVRAFVEGHEAMDYLTERQQFSEEKANRWHRSALRAPTARQPLPAAAALSMTHREVAGAPLAIFLGITLDGIPEPPPKHRSGSRLFRRSRQPLRISPNRCRNGGTCVAARSHN